MVLKEKSACLIPDDPRAENPLHPRATNRTEKPDAGHDVEHINHQRKLEQDQLVSIADMGSGPKDTSCGNKNSERTSQESRRPSA